MATDFEGAGVGAGVNAISVAQAGQVVAVRGEYAVAAALVVSDTIALVKLPANHVLVDCIVDCDDLDDSTGLVLDAGFIGGDVDCLIDGSTVGQAGGLARMDAVAGVRAAATSADRNVGLTVATAPTTGSTGTVGLTLFYKAV
jgi:hypothetical protein